MTILNSELFFRFLFIQLWYMFIILTDDTINVG